MIDSIKDLEAFLAPLKGWEKNEHSKALSWEDYCEFVNSYVVMPDFFTMDERKLKYVLEIVSASEFKLYGPNGENLGTADNIIVLYDKFSEEFDGDLIFKGDVKLVNPKWTEKDSLGFVSVPYVNKKGETDGSFRMLTASDSESSEYFERSNYVNFLKSALKYLKNPEDFMSSWFFINSHPAFWWRRQAEKFPNSWTVDEGISKMWLYPDKNKKSPTGLTFMLETGGAVEPDRTSHYHDLRLDIYAPSYEAAIVAMAAKIHKFFYLDGSDRKDVQYEKSNLELMLEERMAEVDIHGVEPKVTE